MATYYLNESKEKNGEPRRVYLVLGAAHALSLTRDVNNVVIILLMSLILMIRAVPAVRIYSKCFASSLAVMDSSALMKNVLSMIPPLTFSSHKGESGRIGVVGGCREYTGAPYFAAISALKVGCDLPYVFCTSDASPVIKSYSPELIVHPILDSIGAFDEFSDVLPKLHSVVVGPGLGRDDNILVTTRSILESVKQRQLPIVLDADALFYVSRCPDSVRGYEKAILTPNVAEFKRLYGAVFGNSSSANAAVNNEAVCELSKQLGNVTIVRKGPEDVISDGVNTIVCKEPGSPRRCGGQGDLLSGAMAVFNYWADKYSNESNYEQADCKPTIVASLAACMLTRKCSYLAFQKYRRSTTTSDMISEIRTAFTLLFPDD